MHIDLSTQAGLPLWLDTDTLGVATAAGLRFESQARSMQQMQSVLLEPNALPPGVSVYWIHRLYGQAGPGAQLDAAHLAFSCVLVPPMQIGREYGKTQGHYHPAMPGTHISYPEVYTHYYGRLYLLLQRRLNGRAEHLDDCVLVEMQTGQSVMVPPGYAHILINASDGPALMAGLYCPDFTADYQPIRSMAGAAYYLVNGDGVERSIANERYEHAPPLRRLADVAGTRFAPPDPDRPLWTSFSEDPERYRMLTDPVAAQCYFPEEDQQL
jgi:oxalate decarboxylase/phosphoglucose isomerase-like protein (cupin superfamily)